ncbi:MAG TPA: YciI family protein [Pyrinomonadaceae bacterium]|nr:YciI family protein [Pyrinomonadaceae bacterium]
MKSYLLLLRRNQSEDLAIPEADMLSRFGEWIQSLQSRNVLRFVERLKHSAEGATIRAPSGAAEVTGPHSERGESVIGIFLVEVADQAEAQAIAKECPILLVGGSVEVRETDSLPSS